MLKIIRFDGFETRLRALRLCGFVLYPTPDGVAVYFHDISARNIIPGVLTSLEQRDFMITAQVECGIRFEVHLTPGARDSLQLHAGREVWLVLKTHSCQLVMPST